MAAWIVVKDSDQLPGKPVRSADLIAMKDNVTALAEGAIGAPLIVAGALTSTERMNTTNVGNNLTTGYGGLRYAQNSHSAVGSTTSSSLWETKGTTVAGSSLNYRSNIALNGDQVYLSLGMTGTWVSTGGSSNGQQLPPQGSWLRIS